MNRLFNLSFESDNITHLYKTMCLEK